MEDLSSTRPLFTSTLKRPYSDIATDAQFGEPEVKRVKFKVHDGDENASSSVTGLSLDHSSEDVNFGRGQVKLAVYWSQTHLLVHIFGARQFRLKTCSSSNAYVEVSISSSDGNKTCTQRTRKISNSRHPCFNETLTFHREAFRSTNARLLIVAYNQTSTRIKTLGSMSFGVVRLLSGNKEVNGWYHLLNPTLGQDKHLAVTAATTRTDQAKIEGVEPSSEGNMPARSNSILPWISLHSYEIERDTQGKYGFSVLDTVPVKIGTVHKGSLAETSGIQAGDAFLEVGGHSVAGVRSAVIISLLKEATGPLHVLLQRTNTIPHQRNTVTKKHLSQKPPPAPKPEIVKESPKQKRKFLKNLSPRIEALLNRTKPIVGRRLERELVAKVAQRTARQNEHKSLEKASSCSSTYSNASTATCISRQDSSKTKQGSLKRRSCDLIRSICLNRRSRDLSETHSLSTNPAPQTSDDSQDIGMISGIRNDDRDESDRNSSSSWESDLMASIATNDLIALESVLDEPSEGALSSRDYEGSNENPSVGPDTLSQTQQNSTLSRTSVINGASLIEEETSKVRLTKTWAELVANRNGKQPTETGSDTELADSSLHNTGQRIIWERNVTPIPLGPPCRQLIHTGRVFVQRKPRKLREMLLLLYDDILLFTKPLSKSCIKVVCCPLVIYEISVLDFNCRLAREFRLTLVAEAPPHPLASRGRTIVLRAPTAKLKMTWCKLLQHRIMEVKCKGQPGFE